MNKRMFSVSLLNQIQKYIIKEHFDLIEKKILLAISGGQDSVCLLFILLQLQNQFNMKIGSIYCNHLWNCVKLSQVTHLIKINFLINKTFFFTIATKKVFNEKDSRIWRYLNIYRVSKFYNYEILLTGHTLTDRVETLLLNLFRGSGRYGLVALRSNQIIKNQYTKQIFLSKINLV